MSQISASILIDILIKYILIKKKECIRISFVYTETLRPQQVIENDVFDPVLVKVQFVVVVVFAVIREEENFSLSFGRFAVSGNET